MDDMSSAEITRWLIRHENEITDNTRAVSSLNTHAAVLETKMDSLNRRMAWVITFLGLLTISVVGAAVTIALAVHK
jgi:hypothetical protein